MMEITKQELQSFDEMQGGSCSDFRLDNPIDNPKRLKELLTIHNLILPDEKLTEKELKALYVKKQKEYEKKEKNPYTLEELFELVSC